MSDPEPPPFSDPPQADEIDLAKVHGSILREHREPAEGCESVPLWLVGIIMALVFWGGSYLAFNSGGFRADAFVPRRGMNSEAALAAGDTAALGKKIYTQNCVLCHQADGEGIPRVYPPLAGSEWALAQDWRGDNHVVSIVLHGLQGPVRVRGGAFNGVMPGWGFLRDEEIAAVLTYIRTQWGNAAPPITAPFVKQVRERTAARAAPWSQNELRAIARESAPPPPLPALEHPVMKARQ